VISVGVGAPPPIKIDPETVNIFDWFNAIEDLFINTEVTTHDYLTKLFSNKYWRFEVYT
jgi:hypothetical protein